MDRREALKTVSLIFGTTIVGAGAFLSGCVKTKSSGKILNHAELLLLNEVAETLLPKTDTPGAKDADVASFMNTIVSDYYTMDEQEVFKNGINSINYVSSSAFSKSFVDLNSEQRAEILMGLEKQAASFNASRQTAEHYYMMIKQLSIWAFLSSEIVAKKAFIHLPIPTKYVGEIDYKPGDKIIYEEIHAGNAWSIAKNSIQS